MLNDDQLQAATLVLVEGLDDGADRPIGAPGTGVKIIGQNRFEIRKQDSDLDAAFHRVGDQRGPVRESQLLRSFGPELRVGIEHPKREPDRPRSEARRVGKEGVRTCRYWWWAEH